MRDARFVHASLPFFLPGVSKRLRCALLALAALIGATSAQAQTVRPWLDWRTVETENFVFHFPERYRTWTLALAERMEGIREQVGRIVGYLPPRRVHIVVDDPTNDANGAAFTALDAPTIVLFPTPPDPREEIGNFRVWGELVATHEFAHVAHLNRSSRNRLQNLYWALSPVPLGPIPVNAPRWALEGYATYVEGRVTRSGAAPPCHIAGQATRVPRDSVPDMPVGRMTLPKGVARLVRSDPREDFMQNAPLEILQPYFGNLDQPLAAG